MKRFYQQVGEWIDVSYIKLPDAVKFSWRVKHLLKRKLDQRFCERDLPLEPCASRDVGSAILNASESHIFFDIFDTLIQRTINPENSKILSCQRLVAMAGLIGIDGRSLYKIRHNLEARLCRQQYDKNSELEFSLPELSGYLYDMLYADERLAPDCSRGSFKDLLIHCELLTEKSVLTPIESMISALNQATAIGKTCILVSDFYLPASLMRQLLSPFGVLDKIDGLFVSCDTMTSKRSGRLYDHVLEHLNINAEDALMVGDNVWSDINNARQRGLNTLYVSDTERQSFYTSRESKVTDAGLFRRRSNNIFLPQHLKATANFRPLAATLFLFIERLYRTLRQKKHQHVFFLSREVQIFERLFNLYQDFLAAPDKYRITTHYLLVSRRSTYIASLGPLKQENFEKLLQQYRRISLADFLRSIGFSKTLITELADELCTKPYQTFDHFPISPCFKKLIKNEKFAIHYEKLRTEQKDNLLNYIVEFGVNFSEYPLVLVDVGWKGSIQDNLRKVLPEEIDIEGYYLGLVAPGDDADRKQGLLFSYQEQRLSPYFPIFAENRSLFEIILPADHGSALRYIRQNDGSIDVELEEHGDEDGYVENTVMPIVKEIIRAFEEFLTMYLRQAPKEAELVGIVASIHAQPVLSPNPAQLRWLEQIHHRENFGLFINSRFGETREQEATERLDFIKKLWRNPREEIIGSFWPYYSLRMKGGVPIATAYRWARLSQSRWRLLKQTNPGVRS